MASLYLDESIPSGSVSIGDVITIRGAEAKHAVAVSRVRPGDQIAVGNGAGLVAWGEVTSATPTELSLVVEMVSETEAPQPRLGLVQALAKGDRDELAVQAATELGVAAITPWAAQRSVSRWDGVKQSRGRERWQTIAREASKQSIRSTVPPVAPIATTAELAALAAIDQVLVLDPTGSEALSAVELTATGTIWLVVGPEGGISDKELTQLESAGARRVTLGTGILRTSTAGPAAIAVLNARLGRW
jgi:16S rRNA (uracil1498-N3)-methyltransferase